MSLAFEVKQGLTVLEWSQTHQPYLTLSVDEMELKKSKVQSCCPAATCGWLELNKSATTVTKCLFPEADTLSSIENTVCKNEPIYISLFNF